MTIGTVVTVVGTWIGERSVWWLLVVVPAFLVLREMWQEEVFKLWRWRTKRRLRELEREMAADKSVGDIDTLVWREWQHAALKDLVEQHPVTVLLKVTPDEGIASYDRRWRAMADAVFLAEDQAFIARRKAELAADPAIIAMQKLRGMLSDEADD